VTHVEALDFVLCAPDLLAARASARRFDPHMHDTWSVIVLTKGSAALRSRRWSAVARAGDAVLVNPYEVHEGIGLADAVEYWVLYPSRRFVSDHVPGGRLPRFRAGSLPAGAQTRALLDALATDAPAASRVGDALGGVLGCCALEGASPDGSVAAVDEACRLIEGLDHACLRTGALADAVGLHPSHFVRTFHRTTGLAPQTYVRQVRVSRALALIRAGTALAEAALAAGFCDQAHLTREFRKVYGVAPGRLSRSARKSRSRSGRAARAG
jgi:AraC-like DNA-binding protein